MNNSKNVETKDLETPEEETVCFECGYRGGIGAKVCVKCGAHLK